MTDDQIEQVLQRTRRKVFLQTCTLPAIGWGAFALALGACLWSGFLPLVGIFGILLFIPAVQVSREARMAWSKFKKAPALTLWRALIENPHLFGSSSSSPQLKDSLSQIYTDDVCGEVLPIAQAARLLFIYNLQQQRRSTILRRIAQMQNVREQLLEKVARLEELSDPHPSFANGINEMESEISALESLGSDISASCHRLEAIVFSVQKTVQVKQIHREIAGLRSSVSSSKGSAQSLVGPELTDLERQIGREIETFLQLERETDAHLRDV